MERAAAVSIPRSEFWLFGLLAGRGVDDAMRGFNSPLGILVVRTINAEIAQRWLHRCFNSPLGILVVRTYQRLGLPG